VSDEFGRRHPVPGLSRRHPVPGLRRFAFTYDRRSGYLSKKRVEDVSTRRVSKVPPGDVFRISRRRGDRTISEPSPSSYRRQFSISDLPYYTTMSAVFDRLCGSKNERLKRPKVRTTGEYRHGW
jgi:hypothetical protein